MKKVSFIILLMLFAFADESIAQKGKSRMNLKAKAAIEHALNTNVFVHITANKNPVIDVQAPKGSFLRDSLFIKKQVAQLSYLKTTGDIQVVKLIKAPKAPGWIRDSMFVAVVKLPKATSTRHRSSLDLINGFEQTSPIARVVTKGDKLDQKITSPGDIPLFKEIKGREKHYALIPITRTKTGLKVCACTGGGSNGDPPTRY